MEHGHVTVGENGWRSAPDGGSVRPIAVPGRYRVRLIAGSEERTAMLEVLQDPETEATAAEMQAQLDLQLELREMSDSTSALINRIEWTRKGIMDLDERLGGNGAYADVLTAASELGS